MELNKLVLGLLFASLLVFGCLEQPKQTTTTTVTLAPTYYPTITPTPTPTPTPKPVAGPGTIIVGISDALEQGAKLNASLVTSLVLSITRVEVHEANAGNESGWHTIDATTQVIDLIQLQQVMQLVANATIQSGKYNQIRLTLGRFPGIPAATAVINGTPTVVKVPSKLLKITGVIEVEGNRTSFMGLDFNVSESLHKLANGDVILRPVIKIVAYKNAELEVDANKTIRLRGGDRTEDSVSEIDEQGERKKYE